MTRIFLLSLCVIAIGCKKQNPDANDSFVTEFSDMKLDQWRDPPSNMNRNARCDTVFAPLPDNRYQDNPATLNSAGDWNHPFFKQGIFKTEATPDVLKITVIKIKRQNASFQNDQWQFTQNSAGQSYIDREKDRPFVRYFSNGTAEEVFPGSSSTKFMSLTALGSRLRIKSQGKFGLDSWVEDTVDASQSKIKRRPNLKFLPFGDLVTFVTGYSGREITDHSRASNEKERGRHPNLTSNNIGTWAQMMLDGYGTYMLHNWMKRPKTERLDGGYGEYSSGLSNKFSSKEGTFELPVVTNAEDVRQGKNELSSKTIAEFLRRLVLHRELGQYSGMQIPSLTWEDATKILYGSYRPLITREQISYLYKNNLIFDYSLKKRKDYKPAISNEDLEKNIDTMFQRQNEEQGFDENLYSEYFHYEPRGGMFVSMSSYLQDALYAQQFQPIANSFGQWRTFTKIGLSSSMDFTYHGYACVPTYKDTSFTAPSGKTYPVTVPIGGQEFIISLAVMGSRSNVSGTGPEREMKLDKIVTRVVQEVTDGIMSGKLD